MLSLRGKWFVELPEASSLLKAEHAVSKAFFTSPVDDYRQPYAAHNEQVPRQCVFFGTINPEAGGYLRDPTGNRRYWPIACGVTGKIDIEGIERDRDQLWAEAVHRYKAGEKCFPSHDEEHALFRNVQQERGEQDPWHEAIEDSLVDLNEVTVAFLLTEVLGIETAKQETRDQNRVVKVLTSLGWRFRSVGKEKETDPDKIAEGKLRKSVRIYARQAPIENALPFKPGTTLSDLHRLRNPVGNDDDMVADEIARRLDEAV
jgi:predicted P-loop ATPase